MKSVWQERRGREDAGRAYGQVFNKVPEGDKTYCSRELSYVVHI